MTDTVEVPVKWLEKLFENTGSISVITYTTKEAIQSAGLTGHIYSAEVFLSIENQYQVTTKEKDNELK